MNLTPCDRLPSRRSSRARRRSHSFSLTGGKLIRRRGCKSQGWSMIQ